MPYIEEDQEERLEPTTGVSEDEELLEEIRTNFDSDMDYWGPIRDEGDVDMRFLAGDPWDPNERNSRTNGAPDTQRLCLSFDELNQNVNQVVNNFLQNKPAIKIEPKGSGAFDKTAELREDMIRQIEYRSNATSAYAVAFGNAVRRSYGFFQICRDFESAHSFNQEIYIEAIPNPNSILPDPNGVKLDGSDWKRCFKLKDYTYSEYKRNWPNAKFQSFSPDMLRQYPQWINEKRVQVCEYWRVNEERRTLLALDNPIEIEGKRITSIIPEEYEEYEFKLKNRTLYLGKQPVAMVLAKRPTITKSVCQYISNGIEILEENEQPGEYIPIIPMYGPELWLNDAAGAKRVIMSLIRLARDPQTAYAYLRTTQMEIVGQVPKAPYIGYTGQFESMKEQWLKVNRIRIPYLQVDPVLDATGNQLLPLPQQTHYEPAIQAMEILAESQRRAIQSAMGISPLPTSALRQNEKSGIALRQIEQNQSIGSYHFMDNAKMSIAHGGKIINSWLAPTYDTPRDVGIRKSDETFTVTKTFQQIQDEQTQELVEKNLLEIGEHEVTVSTGPSYQSQRQEASEFADLLAQNQMAFPILGPLIVRLKNLGPIGEQMAEDLEFLQPPELRAKNQAKADGQQPSAPQDQAKIAELTQQIALAQQVIQELQVKANQEQTKIQTTQMTNESSLAKEQLAKMTELERVQLELQAESERLDKQLATQKEIAAANNRTQIVVKLMDKTHEANLAILNHEVEAIKRDLDLVVQDETLKLSHQQQMEAKAMEHAQGEQSADNQTQRDREMTAEDREASREDAEAAHERAKEMKEIEVKAKNLTRKDE